MKIEPNILILYEELDNQIEIGRSQHGWITIFKNHLSKVLKELGGIAPNYCDIRSITDVDVETISNCEILITCLSPSFLNGSGPTVFNTVFEEWDKHEHIISKQLLKVCISTVNDELVPKALRYVRPSDFFRIDYQYKEVIEYSESREAHNYWMVLMDLAYKINQKYLQSLLSQNQEKRKVFIAEVGLDLVEARKQVARDLERNGYDVLPIAIPFEDEEQFEMAFAADFMECDLYVQLIGEDAGHIPAGQEYSIPERQLHASERLIKNGVFRNRIFWIPPKVYELEKYNFPLYEQVSKINNVEVLEIGLEDLKRLVRESVPTERPTHTAPNRASDSRATLGKSLYLIYDKLDSFEIQPIKRILENQGFSLIMSRFDGDVIELRKEHKNNLVKCDSVLIYYSSGNENWIKAKVKELLKAPGFGRKKKFTNSAILVNQDKSLDYLSIPTGIDTIGLKKGIDPLDLLKSIFVNVEQA